MNNSTGAFAIVILYLIVWGLAKSFIKHWDRPAKAQWLPVKLKRLHKPMGRYT